MTQSFFPLILGYNSHINFFKGLSYILGKGVQMKLRYKLHSLTVAFTVIAIIVLSFILILISRQNFYSVESIVYKDKVDTAQVALENEFYSLEYTLTDWTKWDLTYDFVNGDDNNFIDENLSGDILDGLDLDYLYIFNDSGTLLYDQMRSESGKSTAMDIAALDTFKDYPDQTGILSIGDQLVIFSAMRITNNEGTAAPKGFMGFAKRIDSDSIELFNIETSMDFSTEKVVLSSENQSGFISGHFDISSRLQHSQDNYSDLKFVLPILNSNQSLVLTANLENAIQRLGVRFTYIAVFLIFLILSFFAVLLNIAFERVVINRLLELNGQIAFIRKSRSTKERLSSKGYDEIGELGENINLMLEEIDEIHTELSKLAAYDDMTGVYNRRIGLDILDGLIKSFKNSEATFSVIYLDVDNLKSVNDQFGHSTGDEMITDSIKLVLDTIPDPRYVVRLGGDEFLVILKNHDLEKAKSIEKKIVLAIDQFNQISNKVYSLSFSMGVIEYEKTMQLEEILELADKEMYHSKEKKRSKILNK